MAKKKTQIKKENVQYRPPIVTLMGHVDHGKTSLLDALRESQITSTESGGITQHTGAYTVEKDGEKITFIDTPGHEAFTEMRARGGQAADIVVLVIAADDGVMPQTKEAIMHAKAAKVPIIVAINKCDLESANIEKVKRGLSQEEIFTEGYGGDVVAVEVSAVKGTGLNELLDVINLTAEMVQDTLVADASGSLEALIVESKKDSKKGSIINTVIKNGTLKVRDDIIAGEIEARVKSLSDTNGNLVKEAIPGDAVEILGFSELPMVGDILYRQGEKKPKVKKVVEVKKETTEEKEKVSEEQKESKILNIVVRADTIGTQEAIISSIMKLSVEEAVPNILFAGTGDVKESDVLLASSGQAVVMAFKVNVPGSVYEMAKAQKVIIREHDIIYRIIEEVEDALEGVLEIEESKIKGRGMVIKLFTLPKSQMTVIGTLVEAGQFKQSNRIGVFRDDPDNPLHVSRIRSLHIGQKEVQNAKKGDEVGLLLKPQVEDIQLEDRIEIL